MSNFPPDTWYCVLCWRTGNDYASHATVVAIDLKRHHDMSAYLPDVAGGVRCPGDVRRIVRPVKAQSTRAKAGTLPLVVSDTLTIE